MIALHPCIRPLLPILLALAAQAQTESGQITGFVTDHAGRAIAKASITLISRSMTGTRLAVTTREGAYAIAGLLPGSYSIQVSASGFAVTSRIIQVHVGSSGVENLRLEHDGEGPGQPAGTPEIREIQAGTQLVITQDEVPDQSRDPFWLVGLAGNLSGAGLGTRGAGFAMNGQRESSTAILFDGASNNNEFFGAIGQHFPLDGIAEISVIAGGFPARYGRASGGIVNAVSKSGTNQFRGSLYEQIGPSTLAANTYLANSERLQRPVFTRNDAGYTLGGPLIRQKLYFFSNTEVTTLRRQATQFAWVPTPQLLAQTASNTQAFFQALGQLRPSASTIGSVSLNDLAAANGANPCTGLACANLSPGTPLFQHVAYRAPAYSAAGWPQNTVQTFARADYSKSPSIWIYARYSLYRETTPAGSLSNSPYSNYDLGLRWLEDTAAVSLLHSWPARWTSETTLEFSRLGFREQGLTSRGLVPAMYANPFAPVTIGSDPLAFPGYNPFTPGSGGAFGGPENILQANHEATWIRGKHLLRLGGSIGTIRDNITDAAYQTAVASLSSGVGAGPALNGLLAGTFAHFQVAVNPQGKYPCPNGNPAPGCLLTLPATAPYFSRNDIYNDGSLYVEDSWTLRRRISVDIGIRWEHFGVHHDRRAALDSNWYAPGSGSADANLGAYLREGAIELAPQSAVGRLWKPDWKDFAPRAGFAWDVFGSGSTVIRGAYGIGYERNFDNVTFNAIQNPPNYAVLDVPGPITTANFGSLANGGSLPVPPLGARIVNPGLKTAYAHFWSASAERRLTRALTYRLEYSGSKGVRLYSISYPNQAGFGNLVLGDPCIGAGDCTSQPNSTYNEQVGYRSNQGFSTYQGINSRLTVSNLFHLGLSLTANYTWSHAIDNLSSTFFEAGGQGVLSQYGDQNITVNNGSFVAGLLDPYNPRLDRGDAEFDVRHRVVVAGAWSLPSYRRSGWRGILTSGWGLIPIFLARSGQPFSVFDTSQQTLDLSAPRAAFTGPHPSKKNTFIAASNPDLFHLITFFPAQILRQPNVLTAEARWPATMSARDSFRAPGFWNLDLALRKNTQVRDRYTLQLRVDFYNAFNHANLYIIGDSADLGRGNTVDGCFGCTGSSYDQRQIQLTIRVWRSEQ